MAANDGKRLTVFGLGFRDHDNRQMQQILRHYNRLPTEVNRTTLYVALTLLAKEVNEEESQSLTTWLTNGAKVAEFPFGQAPPPTLASQPSMHQATFNQNYNNHGSYGRPPYLGQQSSQGMQEIENALDVGGYTPYNPRFGGRGRTIEDGGPSDITERPSGDMVSMTGAETGSLDPNLGAAGAREESFEENRVAEATHRPGPRIPVRRRGIQELDDDEMNEWDSLTSDTESDFDDNDEDVDEHDEDKEMLDMAMSLAPDQRPIEIECLICFETLPTPDFPNDKITRRCKHKSKVCFACINASIKEPIARGALHLIVCPLCPQKLARHDIKTYATKEVFDR